MNSFLVTLNDLRRGSAAVELSEELSTLIGAVRNTAKAGSLTLKLTVRPASKGSAEQVFIDYTVSKKLPEIPQKPTLYFTTEENELTRNDPYQKEFDLQTVEGGAEKEPPKRVEAMGG